MARKTVSLRLHCATPFKTYLNADALSRKLNIDKCLAVTEEEDCFDMNPEQTKDKIYVKLYNVSAPTRDQISNKSQLSTTKKSRCGQYLKN